MNCSRLTYIMNHTTVINTFNRDNSNIDFIKTQHRQIMAIITYRIWKFERKIKKPLVTNYILIQHLQDLIFINFKWIATKIIYHLFIYNFYKHNRLDLLAGNICVHKYRLAHLNHESQYKL